MSAGTDKALFPKSERLHKKKAFAYLFEHGHSIRVGVLSCFYAFDVPEGLADAPVAAAFTVSKRKFKHAVDRNMLKRRMKEAYRLNKHLLISDIKADSDRRLIILFVYQPRDPLPFKVIEKATLKIIRRLQHKIPSKSADFPVP